MLIIVISRVRRGIFEHYISNDRLQQTRYSMEDVMHGKLPSWSHLSLYVQYSAQNRTWIIPKVSDTLRQRLLHIIAVGKFKLTKALGSNCSMQRQQLNKHNGVKGQRGVRAHSLSSYPTNHVVVIMVLWEMWEIRKCRLRTKKTQKQLLQ